MNNRLRFLIVGAVSVLLFVSFLIGNQFDLGVARAEAKTGSQGVIAVTGEGVIEAKPDIAYITLGVRTENKNAKIAQSENATKMNNVMSELKKQGVKEEDIQTTQYSIYPNHRYNQNTGESTIDRYIVQNTVRVILRDIDSVGSVIDSVTKNDSNIINNIEFGLSDSSKYYVKALTKATADAKIKADAIAKSIEVTISKPSKIIEANQAQAQPIIQAREMTDMRVESTPIASGQLEVKASIIVEYNY